MARAQAPTWQTAVAAAGNYSGANATAADANGNVYIAGFFFNTATFGSTTLTGVGQQDMFVAKWSSSSNRFVWAVRGGGAVNDVATAISVSGSAIYVAGFFGGPTATFGTTTLTNAGGDDVFVTKIVDAGATASFSWAQRAGGTDTDRATALVSNGASLYLSGIFGRTATFDGIALTARSNGGLDSFVAKLTDGGGSAGFTWVQQADGAVNALAVAGTSIYGVGSFSTPTALFGNIVLTNANPTAVFGSGDAFVFKLTDAGTMATFGWAQRVGGPDGEAAYALAVAGPSVYIAGGFASAAVSFGSTTLTSAGDPEVFVAKLTDTSTSGTFVWARQAGGTASDIARTMAVAGPNIYIAGYSTNAATFGSTTLPSEGAFVAKLTDAGNTGSFVWAQQGTGVDVGNLFVGGADVLIAGILNSTTSFGNITLTRPSANPVAFLASLTDPTLLATTAAQGLLPFTLAPNPARAATTVALPAQPGTATATLTLRDALGRALRSETVQLPTAGLRHELDLSGLPAGLYAVQVQAGPATATRRLVLE
ncbi:hypothetical protein GCM10027345_44660 [Hymenobacter daeguensis]